MKIKHFLAVLVSMVALSLFVQPVTFAQVPEPCMGLSDEVLKDCMKENAPAVGACADTRFLTFPAWYRGLAISSADSSGSPSCDIKSPDEVGGLDRFIWIIVLNVVEMLLQAAGYAAVAYIIYGGYKYMISTGSADGVAGAKKTITNAVVGLVLSIAAVAIVRTVSIGLGLGG